MNHLNAPCRCAKCGDDMPAGSPFVWVSRPRTVVGGKVGGSYSLRQVDRSVPAHADDCLARKVAADSAKRARDNTATAIAYARAHGATEAEIAALGAA